ncbi:MAG: cytoplasmic protein [Deltaproteobacteria bacterium]|nr:cytoplasmic protein [Deltaproteobacteria bacterium]
MSQHKHDFVENWTGPLAQGFDRPTDEATLKVYLQKISDDDMLEILLPRLSDEELGEFFRLVAVTLRRHLSDAEYHERFLKEAPAGGSRQL